ncbi:hypothetical protein ABZY45_13920 [Streptomyces sp. NPDC006516]|uniref:hypothetical protein n=1 Tax=Streptomyces sp. NPDC006516 TaxID=3154309 RepID=UPI0033B81DD9
MDTSGISLVKLGDPRLCVACRLFEKIEGLKVDIEHPHAAIEVPEGSWWDWDVLAWDGGQFRLAAGSDLSYHHGLELAFTDPVFVSCPADFHDPFFRAPTPEELLKVTRQLGGRPPVLVAFEANAGGSEPVSCLVAADRLDIVRTAAGFIRYDGPMARPASPRRSLSTSSRRAGVSE